MASNVGDALLNITVDKAALGRTLQSVLGSQEGLFKAQGQKAGKAFGESVSAGASGGLSSFQKFGGGVVAVGAIVSAVGLKMALDFESSLTSIKALTGSSSKDIALYRESILSLSGEVAQSPKALAEALYFVSSAGFAGKEAVDVLTISAKAAAAGLTDTKVVADAVTSAMNAYGHANLTAQHASDILVQSVTDGKAEFADMAGAIGQTLGPAAAAGIKFEEVGASMAAMTSIGISADEAATVLKSTIVALEAPSEKAAKMLAQLGLSTDDVRRSIKEKGLIGTIKDLGDKLGNNVGPLLELIPNHRALALVLGVTQQQAGQYTEILGRMTHASDGAGATSKAFGERLKDPSFQFKQMVSFGQALVVTLGEKLIPIFVVAMQTIRGFAGFLDDNRIAAYALAVVIGGPLVAAAVAWTVAEVRIIAGKLIAFWSSAADVAVGLVARLLGLNTALEAIGTTEGVVATETAAMNSAFSLSWGALGAGAAVVAALGIEFKLMRDRLHENAKAAEEWAKSYADSLGGVNEKTLPQISSAVEQLNKVSNRGWHLGIGGMEFFTDQTAKNAASQRDELAKLAQAYIDAGKKSGVAAADAALKQGASSETIVKAAQAIKDKHDEAAASVVSAFARIGGSMGQYAEVVTADLSRSDEALKSLADSADKVREAYGALAPAAAQGLVALVAQGKLTADQLAGVAQEAKTLRDGMASSFGSATSIVQKFGDQATVTGAQIKQFFAEQVAAARDWSANIVTLAASTIDKGLLAEVAQAGPKMAPLVKGLLDAVKTGNVGAINQAQTDLRAALSAAQNAVLGAATPFFIAGQTDGIGVSQGLGQGVAGAGAAMRSALQTALDAANLNAIMKARGLEAGGYFVLGMNGAILGYTREQLQAAGGRLPGVPGSGIAGPPPPVHRAGGGPVWPGRDFVVGEHGREVLRFDYPGHIWPAGQTPTTRGNDGGDMPDRIVVESHTYLDGREVTSSTAPYRAGSDRRYRRAH
jgi:TP901 family phage tail tape measure protein